MYIFVNKDLKMSTGKIAAQVGHGVGYIYKNIYNQSNNIIHNFHQWEENSNSKICLKTSLDKMKEIAQNYDGIFVIDEGRTQIESGSITVLCLYPIDKTNNFCDIKLL